MRTSLLAFVLLSVGVGCAATASESASGLSESGPSLRIALSASECGKEADCLPLTNDERLGVKMPDGRIVAIERLAYPSFDKASMDVTIIRDGKSETTRVAPEEHNILRPFGGVSVYGRSIGTNFGFTRVAPEEHNILDAEVTISEASSDKSFDFMITYEPGLSLVVSTSANTELVIDFEDNNAPLIQGIPERVQWVLPEPEGFP